MHGEEQSKSLEAVPRSSIFHTPLKNDLQICDQIAVLTTSILFELIYPLIQ